MSPALWTVVVLAIGLAIGVVLALVPRPGRPGPGPRIDPFETLEDIDVIVSTVGLALLSALFVVYAKTYSDTGASSALGLIFVLAAFLFEGVLTSPILFGAFGHALGELGPFVLVAHGFRTASTAPGSSRVVVSPISWPDTRDRITRRMIFPLRVFGSFSVT